MFFIMIDRAMTRIFFLFGRMQYSAGACDKEIIDDKLVGAGQVGQQQEGHAENLNALSPSYANDAF